MKIKTSELTGRALDWAVGIAQGWVVFPTDSIEQGKIFHCEPDKVPFGRRARVASFRPSTNWEQGGPIIEREGISVDYDESWHAHILDPDGYTPQGHGNTALEAAMRCYVKSKLGDKIEIPEELL